jgi:hypothetical protein
VLDIEGIERCGNLELALLESAASISSAILVPPPDVPVEAERVS